MNQTYVQEKMMMLKSGSNELFTDPDPDAARGFFRGKSRAMASKVTTAREAVKLQPPELTERILL